MYFFASHSSRPLLMPSAVISKRVSSILSFLSHTFFTLCHVSEPAGFPVNDNNKGEQRTLVVDGPLTTASMIKEDQRLHSCAVPSPQTLSLLHNFRVFIDNAQSTISKIHQRKATIFFKNFIIHRRIALQNYAMFISRPPF